MISSHEFKARRKRVLAAMEPDSIALISAASVQFRNNDTEYPYRQHSDFWYLTGFNEPDAVAILISGRKEGEFVLFNRPRDPAKEVWTGFYAGQEGAIKTFGADQAFSIDQLGEQLPTLLLNKKRVYWLLGEDLIAQQYVEAAVKSLQRNIRGGATAPTEYVDFATIVHEMRLIKSEAEIECIQHAVDISVAAHINVMKCCRPNLYEYELEAQLLHDFYQKGCRYPAYPSIVGAGKNSCILHYNDNNAKIKDGDLILIDAGSEFQGYASDLTRTFPVNGRFSAEQKAIYSIVLNAQEIVIQAIKPGVARDYLETLAQQCITEGLVKIGLLQGDVKQLIEAKAFTQFYMHRIGHWMGLDVHDKGAYKKDGQWRHLQPGMVLTVEPGIYIAENTEPVDKKWWNIGVRIEDDVLVTESGCRILSHALPKTITEIEALCTDASGN